MITYNKLKIGDIVTLDTKEIPSITSSYKFRHVCGYYKYLTGLKVKITNLGTDYGWCYIVETTIIDNKKIPAEKKRDYEIGGRFELYSVQDTYAGGERPANNYLPFIVKPKEPLTWRKAMEILDEV